MFWIPFIFLGLGCLIGFQRFSAKHSASIDNISTGALVLLMLILGAKIGCNENLMQSLALFGFRCIFTAASVIAFSVVCIVIIEKTLLPLEKIRREISSTIDFETNLAEEPDTSTDKTFSPLVWIMPGSILAGICIGYYLLPEQSASLLDTLLFVSLAILYTSVGTSFGMNKSVFGYVKKLGWKILLIPIAITCGSLIGGGFAAIVLKIPPYQAITAASGMSYYSLTGAYLTQTLGIETGAYGFLVNVAREFLTVLLMPILVRISKGSPIAGGAAGCMDTMLAPVTRFVGPELGIVALISGTILTLAVPFLLPLMVQLLHP